MYGRVSDPGMEHCRPQVPLAPRNWLDGGQDCLEIAGNAQHATATTRRDMRPSVLLVVSSTLFSHAAGRD